MRCSIWLAGQRGAANPLTAYPASKTILVTCGEMFNVLFTWLFPVHAVLIVHFKCNPYDIKAILKWTAGPANKDKNTHASISLKDYFLTGSPVPSCSCQAIDTEYINSPSDSDGTVTNTNNSLMFQWWTSCSLRGLNVAKCFLLQRGKWALVFPTMLTVAEAPRGIYKRNG